MYKKFIERLASRRVGYFNLRSDDLHEIMPAVDTEFDEELGFDTAGMQYDKPPMPMKALPPSEGYFRAALKKGLRM